MTPAKVPPWYLHFRRGRQGSRRRRDLPEVAQVRCRSGPWPHFPNGVCILEGGGGKGERRGHAPLGYRYRSAPEPRSAREGG